MDSLSEKEVQNRLYVHCVLFTLIIYEHLATVSQAARYVWPWRWKFGTILFLINRYALLSLGAVLLAMAGATRTSSCNIIERLYFLLTIILNLTVILFTAVRASLLWDRSVLVFLVVFGIFSVGTAIYIMNLASVSETYMHSAVRDGVWCYARFDLSPSAQRITNQVAHICAIVGDTVAIVMTWMKMFKNFQQLREFRMATVTECFIRYGTVSFFTLLCLNICMLLIENTTLVNAALHTFSGILVSRFLLGLREVGTTERSDSFLQPPSVLSESATSVIADSI